MTHGLVEVGKVISAHGTLGWVKADLSLNNPLRSEIDLLNVDRISLGFHERRRGKRFFLLRANDCSSMEQACNLIGTKLYVERSVIGNVLAKNEFFACDLIGCFVYDFNSDKKFAQVMGVHNFGSCNILRLGLLSNLVKEEYYEFSEKVFPIVDLELRMLKMVRQ